MPRAKTDLAGVLARLELLEAREQIRSVLSRYSRGVDRTDPDAARECLWPDARLINGAVDTVGQDEPQNTAEKFIEPLFGSYIGSILAETHHMMGNMIIEVQGKTATSETYCIAHHRTHRTPASNEAVVGLKNIPEQDASGDYELFIGLRYLDRLEEREGQWKILERKLVFDWSRYGPYSGVSSGGLWSGTKLYGGHKPNDPFYQR
jgi:hypothetical protein